ncbi:facilitated trehalose transporter Tret1 [Halyomorpha halys]|uniref:facilitated trehalose transporter Tret1 n=1 Tax=Halyomorpha halys TaxID=286706 RepID=UPI0034D28DF6
MISSAAFRQYLVAVVGGLSIFITGTSFAWSTPLLPQLKREDSEFHMTADEGSWLISLIEIGCLLPCVPAGFLADRFGRKTCLLYGTPLYIGTWLLVLWWRTVPALYVMRFVQGITMAINYAILPIYLTEIATASRRGAIANFFSIMWYLGFLYEYVLGAFFEYDGLTWFSLEPPVVFMIAFSFCPESPYFLLMRNRRYEASKTFAWLESKSLEEIEPELIAIEKSILQEKEEKGSWKDVTATSAGRKALGIIIMMSIIFVMCGLSTIMSYIAEIFGTLSGNQEAGNLLTILAGVVVLLATMASGFLSDRLGRRPIIIYFGQLSVISLAVTGTFYYLEEKTLFDLRSYVWVPYVSIVTLLIAAPIAVGVMQALTGELFSNSSRGFASGIYTLSCTIFNGMSLKLYQTIGDNVGYYADYLGFSLCTLLGVMYTFVYLPETKGKTFQEIQLILLNKN